ncbi:testis-specific H1 histone [Rhynchocyon petersi]
MAEAAGPAEPRTESVGTQVKIQPPMGKMCRALPNRGAHSVLRVSQLVLWAIAAHRRLTLAALKKELGNAGYVMRRKSGCQSRERSRPAIKGKFLRVSSSKAIDCFRVLKARKPRRKRRHRKLEEVPRSWRKGQPGLRIPRRRRRTIRKSAKRAREVWRRNAKIEMQIKKRGSKARGHQAKEEARSKGKMQATKEDTRFGTEKAKRPSSKSREKKQDPGKLLKRASPKTALVKTDRVSSGQDLKAPRTKTSTKSESLKTAPVNP